MNINDPTPALDKFLEEIESLKKASRLLSLLYARIPVYYDFPGVSNNVDKTWKEVREYFGYDDSE